MGVVLAIDPGRRQGKALERLTQEFHEHEVIVAASGDDALVVLDRVIPDLVLFPLFIAPGDENRLQGKLRDLADPADRRALTLPLRAFFDWEAQAARPVAAPPRWFYWFKPVAGLAADLAAPGDFADAVRADVLRPRHDALPPIVASTPVRQPLPGAVVTLPSAAAPPPSPAPVSAPELSAAFASALAASAGEGPAAVPPAPTPALPAVLPPPVPAASPADSADGAASPFAAQPSGRPFAPTFASSTAFATADSASADAAGESAEWEEPQEPQPGIVSKIGAALGSVWPLVTGLPRPVQVGAPVVAIVLTLGATGHVGPLLAMSGRVFGSATTRLFPATPKTGIAEIQTVPDGAQVWFAGRQIGVTPLRSEFAAGTHEVELRYRNATRTLSLEVAAGATVVQRIEWGAPRVMGRLLVESDPPGAAVMIDGKPRGNTPLTIDEIAAGKHAVDVLMSGNVVHETVDVKGNKLTTLHSSIYQGWLALFSPIDVKLAVNGRSLSLDDQGRVLLPSGSHQLTIQNRGLGYIESRTVDIRPGDTTPVNVILPKTTLTVTTSSPADVWVDGERVGEAPISDLPVDIGTRAIVVRSAEHGERRATITATMNPARVAIDFSASAP